MRHRAYVKSSVALVCCGTVNVELAKVRVPQVALYRSNCLTSLVVRRLVKPSVHHATLPNILKMRGAPAARKGDNTHIPELLFEQCTSEGVAEAALRLLAEPVAANAQV